MSATQINMERETMFKWKKMALEQENQVELLKSFVKHHQECIELSREREYKLEEKLKAAVELIEVIAREFDEDQDLLPQEWSANVVEFMKKIKGTK